MEPAAGNASAGASPPEEVLLRHHSGGSWTEEDPVSCSLQGSEDEWDTETDRDSAEESEEEAAVANDASRWQWSRGVHLGAGPCAGTGCCGAHRAMEMRKGRLFVVKSFEIVSACGAGGFINRRPRRSGSGSSPTAEATVLRELEQLRGLEHPNLVRLLGGQLVEEGARLALFFELVPAGSVANFLSSFGPLLVPHLKKVMQGSLRGLEYLHSQRPPVAHGDLRGASILIDTALSAKLTGFGLSAVRAGPGHALVSRIGSLPWTSPEVVQGVTEDVDPRKPDIWSIGCVLIELASAEQPWGEEATLDAIMLALKRTRSTRTPPVPAALAGAGHDFAQACFRWAPGQRPTAAELLDHPFLNGGV